MNLVDIIWGGVGFLLTIMVLSYLIGDNFFFRLAAHLFIGLTAGYLALLLIQHVIIPYLIEPLTEGGWTGWLWMGIPLLLILLLLLSQIPRLSGLGSVPLAFLAGLSAAVAIGGAVFGTLIPQVQTVIEGFDTAAWFDRPQETWVRIVDSVVMLIGAVCTLSFFHFGRKWRLEKKTQEVERPRVLEILSKIGEVFIGITLGALFAGVFSSALLALMDRVIDIGAFIGYFLGGGG